MAPTPTTQKSVSSASRPASIQRLGLIAGEGELPVYIANNASKEGVEVISFSVGKDNVGDLRRASNGKLHRITPGMLEENLKLIKSEKIEHVIFAGKINKWILLKNPKLDKRAIAALQQYANNSDDTIMMWIVNELEKEGLCVLPQTRYLANLFVSEGVLTQTQPDAMQLRDIRYGFDIAREMGRLDVGQSVVTKNGMVLAIEAIEGTDECIKRGGRLGRKKGGVVVKVAKPDQDQRFDVPTVGLRTLKRMKSHGLNVLATEANETIYLEREAMVAFADKHGMIITSV